MWPLRLTPIPRPDPPVPRPGLLPRLRRYEPERVEAACARALTINTTSYSSLAAILKSGLDRTRPEREPLLPLPPHTNIRGPGYYR